VNIRAVQYTCMDIAHFSSHQTHVFDFKYAHTVPYNTQYFDMCGVY